MLPRETNIMLSADKNRNRRKKHLRTEALSFEIQTSRIKCSKWIWTVVSTIRPYNVLYTATTDAAQPTTDLRRQCIQM